MRGATEARVLDAGVRPEEEDALLFRLPRIGRPADRLGRLGALRRLVRQKPEMLLIRPTEVRVEVAADGLGYGWRPVREKSLARLVVERLLGLHSGVELGVGGHLEDRQIPKKTEWLWGDYGWPADATSTFYKKTS